MGESETRAALVREKLFVDHNKVFEETVDKASRLLKLDEDGTVHLQLDQSQLGAKAKIELLLLGRYLGHAGGLVEKPTMSDAEIAKHYGLKVSEVQKRVHDLKKSGKVAQSEGREYRLTEARIGEVLADLGA